MTKAELDYYRERADAERGLAEASKCEASRVAHEELSALYLARCELAPSAEGTLSA